VIIDILAVAIAGSNVIARGVFALARDALLPSQLASRSRHETPLGGILVNAAFALAGLVIASGLEDPLALFRTVAVSFSLILMLVYLLLVVGAIRVVRGPSHRTWHWLVLLPAGALPVLGIYGTLNPWPDGPARVGIWLAAALLGLIGLWAAYLRARNREAFDRAGGYPLA
jgi:amino acid transporter